MTKFMQYAVVAAKEALDDAGWHPESPQEQEMTVNPPFSSEVLTQTCSTLYRASA